MHDYEKVFDAATSRRILSELMLARLTEIQGTIDSYKTIHDMRFPPPEPVGEIAHVAPKPLRVLATFANNDLSIADVAGVLRISPVTAHQHIAAARKALKRQTNVGAIKEAVRQGLIDYDFN